MEDVPNLRSLSLPQADTVDMDHGCDGAWQPSTLERLVVSRTRELLSAIQALAHKNICLLSFFHRLKYLEIDLVTNGTFYDSSWVVLLEHWRHLKTLVVHWKVLGESASIRSLVLLLTQIVPTFHR